MRDGRRRLTRRRSDVRILIIVQNLPVPFDRRVWLECQVLRDAGYGVSVVCPKGPGDPSFDVVEEVSLYKYRPYPPNPGKIGFLAEYAYSFLMTALLTWRAWRREGFDAIQACNPPDIFWPIGVLFRALVGAPFVFDHHDLCPELYESRFGGGRGLPYWGLRILERSTHRTADHVISTNDSYRTIAIQRSGKRPERVTVVRTGPDADALHRTSPDPALRRGRRFLVAYIGVMGPQDGVDLAVRAADVIVRQLGRRDVSFSFMGKGDSYGDLVKLRDALGLQTFVEFTGRVPDDVVAAVLSTADVGLCPDPRNPLNDLSTMNKTMEYMAFEVPVVAFDLRETRVSAADAAVYAQPNEVDGYARSIVALLDDEAVRRKMGRAGRERVDNVLAWTHQRQSYLGVYERLLGKPTGPTEVGREQSLAPTSS
jgi:glycosyltransferase involved in cell wall biosynthesis